MEVALCYKGRVALSNQMNFRKSSKGGRGGGSFSIQKFIIQVLDLYKGLFFGHFPKKMQYNFPKMRGGRRPFGIVLKIHPIW